MDAWLNDPMVQASLAPFTVALVVAAALFKLRLGGLAAIAGFCTTVYLVGGLSFTPLTAMKKLLVVALAAPLLGLVADLAFKTTRATGIVLGVVAGAASAWVFWSVLAQKELTQALLAGGGVALFVAVTVCLMAMLEHDSLRAGAAGLGLGLGAGAAAIMGASAALGQYGLGLGAACGGFLLVQMIAGQRIHGGLTFTLSAGAAGALVAAAAHMLASLGWTELALLAAVPLAARLPVPGGWPVWAQAVVVSCYTLACGGAAAGAGWLATRGGPP